MRDLSKRRGRFQVSREVIYNMPDIVMQFMGKVIVVRAESLIMTDSIEYYAYSPEFEIVPDSEVTPKYNCLVTRSIDDSYMGKIIGNSVKFEKVVKRNEIYTGAVEGRIYSE